MKITVANDRCMGHGRCYSLAPDLLDFDDEGYVTIRGRLIDVPGAQADAARDAAASCPEQAVDLIED
ncbi:hypothetical protein GCM10010191_20060 [Actinomadura vinacea]|uniref:Ferredoxin n=1 Tax=Actinomadura vinacea TaxID=115336 RepID=A0ABP5VSQ7_9ACTN